MPAAASALVPRRRPAPNPPGYRRRRPETTTLYEAVRCHLRTFLARVEEEEGEGLPAHVRGELERFLDCGVLAHGFVRVWCPTCKDDLLVAFSCKGRGVCPSCGGRRMAETAARWVDGVLPHVPWRQWVLSLPMALRYRLAWDSKLMTETLSVFQGAVAMRLRSKARRRGLGEGRFASVTVVQRFGSALNLNVHFHSLVADGLWVPGEDGPRFVRVGVTDEDVAWVAARVERRMRVVLARRGLLDEDAAWDGEEPGPVQRLAGASVLQRRALGPQSGRPLLRIGRRRDRGPPRPRRRKRLQASVEGYDVHAALRIPAANRQRLEQLARYLLRPAVPLEQLELLPDGRYLKLLRKPWADGTTAISFDPMELMERLAALIPMPRSNLVRYHGALAPASALRSSIVPKRAEPAPQTACERPPDRIPWAELLRRVFRVNVLICAGCGGRRQILAEVTDPVAARRILKHLGLDPDAPRLEPARAPPGGWSWAS